VLPRLTLALSALAVLAVIGIVVAIAVSAFGLW
jgi:hypothetical protein